MTNPEFSRGFDILYNNITSNQAPPLNEYEKSYFLTSAERALVRSLHNGLASKSFEADEEVTSYLSGLVKDKKYILSDAVHDTTNLDEAEFLSSDNMKMLSFALPSELWWIVYESANVTLGDCTDDHCLTGVYKHGKQVSVIPVTHDTLDRTIEDPFKSPNERKILRLSMGDNNAVGSKRVSNLILRSNDQLNRYYVRYVREPKPIILKALDGSEDDYPEDWKLSLSGMREECECELPTSLHDTILSSAVQMAESVWKNTGNVEGTKN